jgi:hypothetical protein
MCRECTQAAWKQAEEDKRKAEEEAKRAVDERKRAEEEGQVPFRV